MATRDYVKRGKAPRRPQRTSAKKPKKSALSMKYAFFVVALVLSFASGLAFLLWDDSTEPTPTAPQTVQNEKNKIPPKPEAKWTYIQELEKKEIEVTANEQKISNRPYLMQCGAYRSQEQAEERRAVIAFQGLESEIRVNKGSKGDWHRIVLGPYTLKRDAERDRNVLRRAGVEPCEIWFWD